MPNYDESTRGADGLPTRIPNLLVNGSNGIAVGMATNIPPHNLTEIVEAAIMLVNTSSHAAQRNSEDRERPGLPDRRLHLRPQRD